MSYGPVRSIAFAIAFVPLIARAQDGPIKVEALKEGPPAALAAPIKALMNGAAYRVADAKGKGFADIWVRKDIPASAKPGGPKGAILFPVLAEGELLGAVRFSSEAHDYRDQPIAPGVYTIRYGLQPVNGDHLGVSDNRDYALLLPAAKDTSVANLARQKLETGSAEASGTNHPAVFILLAPPEDAKANEPGVAHDDAKMTWGVVLPLTLAPKGESGAVTMPVQMVVVGSAPH